MQQLKERFKQYEPMKSDMKAKTKFGERKDDEAKRSAIRKQSRQTNSDPKRSSNCGGDDHSSVTCPKKEKGVRCFRCNELGHMASRCTAQPKKTYIISRPEKKRYMKDVTIDECRFTSLVDEFPDIVSDREVHQELAHRTKRTDESLLQYMYNMREIAGQGRVDTQSVIYIIWTILSRVFPMRSRIKPYYTGPGICSS